MFTLVVSQLEDYKVRVETVLLHTRPLCLCIIQLSALDSGTILHTREKKVYIGNIWYS